MKLSTSLFVSAGLALLLAIAPVLLTFIAAGCPFCNTMLTDGVKHFNKEGEVQVKDVAELIAEAQTIDFYCIKPIPAGSEILINYNGDANNHEKVWFEK